MKLLGPAEEEAGGAGPQAPAGWYGNVTPLDTSARRVAYPFLLSAGLWLAIGSLYGVLAAWKLVAPDLLPLDWLSFGRIRPVHTASVLLGWLSVGLTGLAYIVVCQTSQRPPFSTVLAHVALACWNLALAAGLVTLSLGITRGPMEYREWVTPVAALFALGVLLNGFNIVATIARRRTAEIYISNWFIAGAFVWLPTLYVIAYLPTFASGVGNVVIQGYYMHTVLGLWFTPMVLGITYWALPRALHKPIYSYSLGVLAFWANLVFYTLIGAHHFVFSPVPWWLQSTAILLGWGMMIPVFASVLNFLLTMRGSGAFIRREAAVWFVIVGAVSYGTASLQGTVQAFRDVNVLVHFTHYTVGHAHFAAYGFVSMLLFGAVYVLLPGLSGARERPLLVRSHFWLATVGLAIYVISMLVAGTLQGVLWVNGAPFIDTVTATRVWLLARAVGGSMMALGNLLFLWNVLVLWPRGRPAEPRLAAARAMDGIAAGRVA